MVTDLLEATVSPGAHSRHPKTGAGDMLSNDLAGFARTRAQGCIARAALPRNAPSPQDTERKAGLETAIVRDRRSQPWVSKRPISPNGIAEDVHVRLFARRCRGCLCAATRAK